MTIADSAACAEEQEREVTHFGEISLDPVSVGLFFRQSGPVFRLWFFLSENEDDGSTRVEFFGFLW